MRKKYAVVFYLPPEMLKAIMHLKEKLFKLVSYFRSINSDGHVTICEILSDAAELKRANDRFLPIKWDLMLLRLKIVVRFTCHPKKLQVYLKNLMVDWSIFIKSSLPILLKSDHLHMSLVYQ